MAISRVPKIQNPKLFDKVIQQLQQGLKDNLSWLDYSFGRAERLVKQIEGKRYYTPNVYLGKNQYEQVTPDAVKMGNYSFFVMEEPQEVTKESPMEVVLRSPFSLVVWVDMRKVGLDGDERNTETVKEQILEAIDRTFLRNGRVTVQRIFERAENVFAGFTLDEIDNQFMMSPFYGWRFYGEMITTNECAI